MEEEVLPVEEVVVEPAPAVGSEVASTEILENDTLQVAHADGHVEVLPL